VDLYLALLVVSLATDMGIGPATTLTLPPFAGFASILILGLLYLAEMAVDLRPPAALVWHNLQLFLRPLGGALLGLAFLGGEPPVVVALGMGLGSIVAAFAHVLAWGGSLLLRLVPGHRLTPLTLNLYEDLGAVGLMVLALKHPDLGFLAATSLLMLSLVLGRPLHAVVRFGWALMEASVWGIVSSRRWLPREAFPRWLRKGTAHLASHGVRGIRAATLGISGRNHFTEGWLIDGCGELLFSYRRKLSARLIPLAGLLEGEPEGDGLAIRIPCRSSMDTRAALFLQKGAPAFKSHK
jgi:hypothetical protein